MNSPSLNQAVERYEQAITALETTGARLTADQILEVLAAREQVREAMNRRGRITLGDRIKTLRAAILQRKPPSAERRLRRRIAQLDTRLGAQSVHINRAVKLEDWHVLLHPPERDWLKLLDPPQEIPFRDRFDWLWQGLSIACLTASLSLLTDIAMRFFEGGPDAIGAFTVIAPSVLGLLAGGGALTKTGKQVIEQILVSMNIAKHWWDELLALIAGFLVVSLMLLWLALPQIAKIYEARADAVYQQGRLSSAEAGYNRALKLNPSQLDLHYKLGKLYEDWRDDDRALSEYQIAVKGAPQGEAYRAYDRLARLYILQADAESYSKAVSLLNEGLGLALARNDLDVLYAAHKNLGWARLKQERYTEAINSLQRAIGLSAERAPAYCLVAQAQDGLQNQTAALTAWEQCLRYANQKDPDEDYWIGLALKRLKSAQEQKVVQP